MLSVLQHKHNPHAQKYYFPVENYVEKSVDNLEVLWKLQCDYEFRIRLRVEYLPLICLVSPRNLGIHD